MDENLSNFATSGSGSVTMSDAQSYKLTGYVNTSHGTVETDVESQLSFTNEQVITNAGDTQGWVQMTRASRKSITHEGPLALEKVDNLTFPVQVQLQLCAESGWFRVADGEFRPEADGIQVGKPAWATCCIPAR